MLRNYNSQTIARGLRKHDNVNSTRSLDKGTWKRRMLDHTKSKVFGLVNVSAN